VIIYIGFEGVANNYLLIR